MGKASDTLHQQIPIILTNTNSKSLCAGKMTVIGKKKTIKKIRKTLEKKDMRHISIAVTVEKEFEAEKFDKAVYHLHNQVKKWFRSLKFLDKIFN